MKKISVSYNREFARRNYLLVIRNFQHWIKSKIWNVLRFFFSSLLLRRQQRLRQLFSLWQGNWQNRKTFHLAFFYTSSFFLLKNLSRKKMFCIFWHSKLQAIFSATFCFTNIQLETRNHMENCYNLRLLLPWNDAKIHQVLLLCITWKKGKLICVLGCEVNN